VQFAGKQRLGNHSHEEFADGHPLEGHSPRPVQANNTFGLAAMPPEAVSAVMGKELGKYRLIAEIGRGGMGVAYLAVLRGPEGFRKLVVVKELRAEFLDTEAWVTMFMGEARLAARLNHPNIVQTIEVGADGSRRFIAMEYLDGQPLQQLVQRALKRSTRMPLRMHLGILLDLLAALEYAHALTDFDGTPLGLVHRDVSPHNVVITYEGQIKLVDFGISKSGVAVEPMRAGAVRGKMRYMAPEQAAGARIDLRADLFAVGAMLWEAIVGRRPWEGQPDAVVLQSLISGALPHLRNAWPDVDPALAAIVERAMSFEPDARYPSAVAMREDLERYIDTRKMEPPSPRALGASVSRLFVDDRDKRRALIDTHLRALNAADPAQRSGPRPGKMMMSASGAYTAAANVEGTLSSPSHAERTPSSNAAAVIPLPAPPTVAPGFRVLAIVAAAGFGALLALGVVARDRFHASDTRLPTRDEPASAPVVIAPTAAAPRAAHVVIVASPAWAQIHLDDVAVSNPYNAEYVREGKEHQLRVAAPGYETRTRALTFAEDMDLEIALRLDPRAPASGRAPVRPSVPPPDCQVPYVTDPMTGKKHWKLECLESDPAPPPYTGESAKHPPKPIDTGSPYAP
jgi:serine/threonine protein kinase